jgi:hypothetical protein
MSNLSIHGIPGSIGQRLTQHRHTALLCALVAAFMVRPVIGDSNFAAIIFNVAMLVILVSALHVLRSDELWGEEPALYAERRRNSFIGWTLATSAAGLRFATFVWPNPT